MSKEVSESSPESITVRFHKAQRKRNTARRIVTLVALLIVVFFIVKIGRTFTDFRDNRLPEFTAELSAEASLLLPGLIEDVREMTERIVPFYMDTFAETFSEHEVEFREVLALEFEALERSAQTSWVKVEEAIAQLVIDQEFTARNALAGLISDEEIARISIAYRLALESYMEQVFSEYLEKHITMGEDILANLEELSQTETDIPTDDSQYIFGMMLELLGLQMQETSGYYTYIVDENF